MKKKNWIICILGLLVTIVSCNSRENIQSKNSNPDQRLSSSIILVHTQNISSLDDTMVFNSILTLCKKYGKTQILEENDAKLRPGILIDILTKRLTEGEPPNLGKELPVIKVNMDFMDYTTKGEHPKYEEMNQYVEISGNTETLGKVTNVLNSMMSHFKEYYLNKGGQNIEPLFILEKPLILQSNGEELSAK